jgi:hypothetical protein
VTQVPRAARNISGPFGVSVGMEAPIRSIAFATARSLALISFAMLLILVLLPAALAVQAASS